jgi:hypothetical protein
MMKVKMVDGENVIEAYDINDTALENNLINNNIDYSNEETYLKAFFQDYMNRIIENKLN